MLFYIHALILDEVYMLGKWHIANCASGRPRVRRPSRRPDVPRLRRAL